MAVLEPQEVDKHSATRALTVANDSSLTRFDEILRAQQVKPGTRSTYLWQLVRLKRQLPNPETPLAEISEDLLLPAMARVADKAQANGFQTFAISVRRFYKTMGRKDLVEKIRVPRRPSHLPQVLTQAEIKRLLDAAGNLRDKLMIELLWESGCRIGELTSLKMKDVQFDQYSGILHVSGKTGERRIRVFACKPDLLEYLNHHPFKNNPNEYLLLSSLGHGGYHHRLTDAGIREILAKLSRRVLNRRVHPHLLRHTRATELSKYMTDRELKIFGGWKRTQMLEVYSHLSGKDMDDKLLALHGIKVREDEQLSTLSVKVCSNPECKAENSPMAIYCQKCSQPLVANSVETVLGDPAFIEKLVQNPQFIDALKKVLKIS
jgi:integrase/recombinase XerD